MINKKLLLFLFFVLFVFFQLHPLTETKAQNQPLKLIRDAEIEQVIRTIAQPILRAANLDPQSVSFILIQDSSLNAFVSAGSNIFIHTGLIEAIDDPGELMGVLAHEIGHITGGHIIARKAFGQKSVAQALIGSLLSIGAAVALQKPEIGIAGLITGPGIARNQLFAYSRIQEASADQAALRFLERAQLPACGMLSFLEKLQDQELLPQTYQSQYLRTHPLIRERIRVIRNHRQSDQCSENILPEVIIEATKRIRAKLTGFLNPNQALLRYTSDDPSAHARYGRAIAFYRQGSTTQALTLFESLIEQEPENSFFYEMKGQILRENGQIQEAIQPYEQAVAYAPEVPLLRISLAQLLLERDDDTLLDSAISHLTKAQQQLVVAQDIQIPFLWRLLATAYGRKKLNGLMHYALTEENFLLGNTQATLLQARYAAQLLPQGSPSWIRVQDIQTAIQGRIP